MLIIKKRAKAIFNRGFTINCSIELINIFKVIINTSFNLIDTQFKQDT